LKGSVFEARLAYITKSAEEAKRVFAPYELAGLVLAGLGDLKKQLQERLDSRLRACFLYFLDVEYSGRTGLNESVRLSKGLFENLKIDEERKALEDIMVSIAGNPQQVAVGENELRTAFGMGVVETTYVWHEKLCDEKFSEFLRNGSEASGSSMIVLGVIFDEMHQFIEAFGGVVGILRYPVDLTAEDDLDEFGDDELFGNDYGFE